MPQFNDSFREELGLLPWEEITPELSSYLTGGIVEDIGVWRYHTFLESGSIGFVDVNGALQVQVLAVAGGGGGGNNVGGGGGAGGFVSDTITISSGQTITVGSGGSGGLTTDDDGAAGGDSSIGSLAVADGGGGGSGSVDSDTSAWASGVGSGGSGGGAGIRDTNQRVGAGTAGQGHDGGTGGSTSAEDASGGGGGASSPGGNSSGTGSATLAGDGGDGATWKDGETYAGGGGGTNLDGTGRPGGAGGAGGGGDGGTNTAAGTAGTPNTGGGGGGGGQTGGDGGDGGSGIVKLRYLRAPNMPKPTFAIVTRELAADATDTDVYTFSDVPIGPPNADREVVVAIGSRKAGATTTISSVTIGGISATEVIQVSANDTNTDVAGLYRAVVPTSETADIVVTFADTMLRCMIGAYTLNDRVASTVTDSGTNTSPLNGTLVGDNPGIGAVSWFGGTVSWTGLTEDFTSDAGENSDFSAASGIASSASATFSSGTEEAGVFAEFSPAVEAVAAQYDGVDTVVASGTASASGTYTGTAAVTDGIDTAVASGTATDPVEATAAVTDGLDTAVGSGALTFEATAAVTDGIDTAVGSGTAASLTAEATAAVTDGLDTAVGSGALTFEATAAATDGIDTAVASGTATDPVEATAAVTDGIDTAVASGIVEVSGSVARTDTRDTVSTTASTVAPSDIPQIVGFEFESTVGTAAGITLTKPAGVATGDLLLLFVACDYTLTPTWTAPSGWTEGPKSGTTTVDTSLVTFWRIADGTEGATEFVANQGSGQYFVGWYLRITGNDLTDPIGVTYENSGLTSATTFNDSTVTTTADNSLVFSFASYDGSDGAHTQTNGNWPLTWPANQEIYNPVPSDATGVWGGWLTKEMPTAGNAGGVTYTAATLDGWAHVAFSINPAITFLDATDGTDTLAATGFQPIIAVAGLTEAVDTLEATTIVYPPPSNMTLRTITSLNPGEVGVTVGDDPTLTHTIISGTVARTAGADPILTEDYAFRGLYDISPTVAIPGDIADGNDWVTLAALGDFQLRLRRDVGTTYRIRADFVTAAAAPTFVTGQLTLANDTTHTIGLGVVRYYATGEIQLWRSNDRWVTWTPILIATNTLVAGLLPDADGEAITLLGGDLRDGPWISIFRAQWGGT